MTKKPPAILIVAIRTDTEAKIMVMAELEEICKIAPIIMIPDMALVTLIKGVCNAGVTFQIT